MRSCAVTDPSFFILRRAPLGCLLVLLALELHGANPTNAPDPGQRQIEPGMFALGQVRIDKGQRAVSFPAKINQREGTVEYVVVHQAGKTHESILSTEVEPQQIHVALLLLGVKAANTNLFPADLSIPPPGEAVTIGISWKTGDQETRRRLEDLVLDKETKKPLPPGPWVYNGSHIFEKSFVAQRDGSIISIHIDSAALVNNPRPDREKDDRFAINPDALPPPNTPVQVTIQLAPARAAEKNP